MEETKDREYLEQVIGTDFGGRTVREYLKEKLHFSERLIARMKYRKNGILLNGVRCRTTAVLTDGDRLRLSVRDPESSSVIWMRPEVILELNILYEDADLLVIFKPEGMVCHPSFGHFRDSLANHAACYLGWEGTSRELHLIGRLDRDTCGLVTVAKNAQAAADLFRQQKEGTYLKTYTALAEGIFREKQGVDKAWYYDATQNALMWTTYDKRQPLQLFKLEKQADGSYSVYNVVAGKYLYHLPYNGVPVPFSDSFESGQVLAPFAGKPYEFKIYSPDFDSQYNKYNTRQHNSGAGVTGQVSAWDSDMDGEASWLLKRVDGTLLDSLLNVSGRDKAQEGLRMAINEAQSLYDKCYDYKSIFTDATQMTVNSQNPSDGSIAALLDNNVNTYFHSDWQQAFKQQMTGGTGWHNMQFALSEAVDKVKFYYFGRINSSGYVDDPDHITLYATNDDALGASTAAADSTSWTEIADLTKPRYDFPAKNLSGSSYTSPVIDLGGSYKYLRFVVKHTNGQGTMASRTFYDPSVSGVTFELSEFRLWDGNPEASSQAKHIDGLDAACNALKEQLSQARDNYGSTRAIARVLKVSQPTIVRKLNKYGLTTEKQ